VIPTGEIRIAPSLLAADYGSLAEAVGHVAGSTSWLHIDVMDGHFVPNLTIGPPVVASLRRHTGSFSDSKGASRRAPGRTGAQSGHAA
jgi:pentose-5-phosphate-3-epimerase